MFLQSIMETFAYSIIVLCVVGLAIGDVARDIYGLFSLGSAGISYQSIVQFFVCAATIGVLRVLLLSDMLFKKAMLLWRVVLLLLLTLVFTGFYIVIFRWFPIDMWRAWVGFAVSFTLCSTLTVLAMILRIRLTDKKYDKLLSDYKAKHIEESGEIL